MELTRQMRVPMESAMIDSSTHSTACAAWHGDMIVGSAR